MVGEYIFKIAFPCTLIHQNTYNSDMIVKSISIQVSSCPASATLLPYVFLSSLFGGTGVSEATPSGAMVPFLQPIHDVLLDDELLLLSEHLALPPLPPPLSPSLPVHVIE